MAVTPEISNRGSQHVEIPDRNPPFAPSIRDQRLRMGIGNQFFHNTSSSEIGK